MDNDQRRRRPGENRRVLPITMLVLCLGWIAFVAWDRLRLERACDHGQGVACQTLGDVFSTGSIRVGIWKDLTRAEKYFRKGCSQGDIQCCVTLMSNFHASDPAVQEAFGKAFKNNAYGEAEEECHKGETHRCLWLGDMHQIADHDHEAAARFYKAACEQGSKPGCQKLADLAQRPK